MELFAWLVLASTVTNLAFLGFLRLRLQRLEERIEELEDIEFNTPFTVVLGDEELN